MARAALHDGTVVVNVIAYDPEQDYTPPEGLELDVLADDAPVGPGYRVTVDGYVAPLPEGLTVNPDPVTVGEPALARFVDYTDTAPAEVTFTVNGATATVALTDGVAELVVTMPAAGDVEVTVDRPGIPPVVIRGV